MGGNVAEVVFYPDLVDWIGRSISLSTAMAGSSCASGLGPHFFGSLGTPSLEDGRESQAFDLGFRVAFRAVELKRKTGPQLLAGVNFHNEERVWTYQVSGVELPGQIVHKINGTHWNEGGYGVYMLLARGAKITFRFLVQSDLKGHPRLRLRHLTTWNAEEKNQGYSPVTIRVNGKVVADKFDPAEAHGGSHDLVVDTFDLLGRLQAGENTVEIELDDTAVTPYWINMVEIWEK